VPDIQKCQQAWLLQSKSLSENIFHNIVSEQVLVRSFNPTLNMEKLNKLSMDNSMPTKRRKKKEKRKERLRPK